MVTALPDVALIIGVGGCRLISKNLQWTWNWNQDQSVVIRCQ